MREVYVEVMVARTGNTVRWSVPGFRIDRNVARTPLVAIWNSVSEVRLQT